jgi:POT family proton-dependent oligopeptide transporter
MQLMGYVGGLWMRTSLWALWLILVVACVLSAAFMFGIMKKLERAAQV